MQMFKNKWQLAWEHLFSSALGFARLMVQHPVFGVRLFGARWSFFLTRQLKIPLTSPDGFCIGSATELISYWSLFVERECWDPEWVRTLRYASKPTVLDVGGNAGLFTHLLWTLNRSAEIVTFEPLPKMAEKIRKWGGATGANIVLHNKAVSDFCGEACFFASAENDTSASLKMENATGFEMKVPVITLDSVVPNKPILLLKIDVEGFECEVLRGAKKTLEQVRFLIVEAHTEEALGRIKQELGGNWRCKRVGASDYFFARRPNHGFENRN